MLNYQFDVFRKTLEEYKIRKDRKSCLSTEKVMESCVVPYDELKRKYKNYPSQDASFREYGFGATMVTIR